MDMLQAGLAADAVLRRKAAERRRGGEDAFYTELDRATVAARRLILTLVACVASASVLVAVVAVSAARGGVLLAGVVQ